MCIYIKFQPHLSAYKNYQTINKVHAKRYLNLFVMVDQYHSYGLSCWLCLESGHRSDHYASTCAMRSPLSLAA
jgi:hypothetical protein